MRLIAGSYNCLEYDWIIADSSTLLFKYFD